MIVADSSSHSDQCIIVGFIRLEAITEEKLYIVAGLEFKDSEQYRYFSEALYGLKSSGKEWAEALYDISKDMDFITSQADPCYG